MNPASEPPAGGAPHLLIRLVSTHNDTTTRSDLTLTGSYGTVLTSGRPPQDFHARRLWAVVKDLLPPVALLRAAPAPTYAADRHAPPADLARACRAGVAVAVILGGLGEGEEAPLSLRTWLATATELYAAPAGGTVLSAAPGALAEELIWDVAGAMEHLAQRLEPAS